MGNECAGGTNHVLLLDDLARYSRDTGDPLCLVSFNYDLLLYQACASVFGLHLHDMDAYISRPDVHVHKPHGAVN